MASRPDCPAAWAAADDADGVPAGALAADGAASLRAEQAVAAAIVSTATTHRVQHAVLMVISCSQCSMPNVRFHLIAKA